MCRDLKQERCITLLVSLHNLHRQITRQPSPVPIGRQRSSLSSLARFLEEYHTPKERMRSARELMGRESFSRGNISYAIALAQTMDGLPESVELERRAQLELIEQMLGVRSKIAELLDPEEIGFVRLRCYCI